MVESTCHLFFMIFFTLCNFSEYVVLFLRMHKRYNNLLHLTKQALFTKFEMKLRIEKMFGEELGDGGRSRVT
jgi:hypothetical protein